VGIIARNCVEWAVTALASYGLRARFIPMYERELSSAWKYIIHDANIKVLFVSTQDVFDQVQAMREELPGLKHLFLIHGSGDQSLPVLEAEGAKDPVSSQQPEKDEIAVLIYTSGTTGRPKGVLLSHGNFTSNVYAAAKLFTNLDHESRSLAILPWAHSYGQTGELYFFMYLGASIGLIRDVTTIAEDMALVKPTFLLTVPRIFNLMHDGIQKTIREKGGLAKLLFDMGLRAAEELRHARNEGRSEPWMAALKYRIADKVVFHKIRERFGGRLTGALSGSATMKLEVGQFFADINIPVYDCYGLSETTPAVTVNCPSAHRPGSVGRAIEDVRVVIDKSIAGGQGEEGEIIVYGPNVMKGYHNMPEATAAVMTEDGGFRTGDCGRLDEDGYLYITGRIKEQYKLENGKYVFPGALEAEIQLLHWVQNVMVYGEGKAFNICIIVPELSFLAEMAREKGLNSDPATMILDPKLTEMAIEEIESHLKGKFGGYEIPKRCILVHENFSIENGMLTQTMKLKRRAVLQAYQGEIDKAYA